jgi:hypothetical protein
LYIRSPYEHPERDPTRVVGCRRSLLFSAARVSKARSCNESVLLDDVVLKM